MSGTAQRCHLFVTPKKLNVDLTATSNSKHFLVDTNDDEEDDYPKYQQTNTNDEENDETEVPIDLDKLPYSAAANI